MNLCADGCGRPAATRFATDACRKRAARRRALGLPESLPPRPGRPLREVRRPRVSAAVRRGATPEWSRSLLGLGSFDIVLADPPWRPDFGLTCSRAVERHYATLELDDLCAMPVPARSSALLLLWTTAPLLRQAMTLLEAWGFSYRTGAVWVKPRQGNGAWLMGRHEHLLIGRRGRFPVFPQGMRPPSVIEAPSAEHSTKPDDPQRWVERAFPDHRKLELFARRRRPGWTCWGDELAQEEP